MTNSITQSQQHHESNLIFRSALFNARNKNKKREYLDSVQIPLIGEGSIIYTGEELRQDDETVWLKILHSALENAPTDHVTFSGYSILKETDWPTTSFYYKKLEEIISCLAATNITIESNLPGNSISCSLIGKYEKFQNSKWNVWIENEILNLFKGNQYTSAEWKQRITLPVGMSTWLHSYLLQQKESVTVSIDLLATEAGLTAKRKENVKEIIKEALQNLVGVGFLESWTIENNMLRVVVFS